jgi:hypothetical protein
MGALRFEREVAREFPALRALLGDARFAELARAFVAQRRSRSFTLGGYAATLPRFLAGARRRALGPARELAAALAIARFELALGRARGFVPGTNPATPAGDLCLAPIPAPGAQLLDLAWDAPAAYVEWQRSGARPRAAKRRTRVAVFARDGRAAWLALAAREAELLASLLRGAHLERAVARAAQGGLSAARIRAAFERWVASGLLCARAGTEARGFVPGTNPR